jgi:transcriptional regulator GlxA family with amidase domain
VAQLRESQRLGQLFDFLHTHLTEPHSVDSLARRVGMSQRTFCVASRRQRERRLPAGYSMSACCGRKIIWKAVV